MIEMRKTIIAILTGILIAGGVTAATRKSNSNLTTLTPDAKLRQAEMFIERYYVDTVNGDSLAEEAIKAMLKTLDPHSTYSTPEETRELNEPLQGNFSGIGIQYNMLNDTLYVIQTIAGGPSERVGLLAGDRIISADDSLLSGVKRPRTEITRMLRGPKGTPVEVKVIRQGVAKPIDFIIVRDDIPLYSVDASYMIDKKNGYIRISRFAEDTAEEVRKALRELRSKGMKNVIIDLEHNGGGYLHSARDIASLFLQTGDTIVFTDNKDNQPVYLTAENGGAFGNGRLVIMVNQYSASASEILSGAIQDYDRGVIVGRRTFGKGLVQRPFPFSDGSMIRLTTSRYYTPSGRCIQKPYENGADDNYSHDIVNRYRKGELTSRDSIKFDENLLYHTLRNNRPVYAGGGIMPDRFVPLDTTYYTDYYRDLLAKGAINKTAMTYVDQHRDNLKKTYKTTTDFINRFNAGQELLDQLVANGAAEGVEPNEEQLATSRDYLLTVLKALIARDIFDTGAYYQVVNELNPTYKAAVDIITSTTEYDNLLAN